MSYNVDLVHYVYVEEFVRQSNSAQVTNKLTWNTDLLHLNSIHVNDETKQLILQILALIHEDVSVDDAISYYIFNDV